MGRGLFSDTWGTVLVSLMSWLIILSFLHSVRLLQFTCLIDRLRRPAGHMLGLLLFSSLSHLSEELNGKAGRFASPEWTIQAL